MQPLTQMQNKSFECGRALIDFYKMISKDHQDPTINRSVIVGDMIADLKYTMARVWSYPLGDIEDIASFAFSQLQSDHVKLVNRG